MKLGFVSAILSNSSFEEVITKAADLGFPCVEVACWPKGQAERRYAGVSHIDVEREDASYISYIQELCLKKHIKISSLAFYPNTLDPDLSKRASNIQHLKKVIQFSSRLGVHMVTTFIGRDQYKTTEENLELVKEIWPSIIAYAEEKNVKLAIENCPMLFDQNQWPGGQNLMTTPELWRKIFEILPSDYIGINYDPSHFIWQQMDYITPIYHFKDKIFHVHLKDIKLHQKKLDEVGIMAYPLQYMSPKIPGYGDVNWGKYISALSDIGYNGYTCIEIEDAYFETSDYMKEKALQLTKHYMEQFII